MKYTNKHTLGLGLTGDGFLISDFDFDFDFCGVSLDLVDDFGGLLPSDDLCLGVPLCFFKPSGSQHIK